MRKLTQRSIIPTCLILWNTITGSSAQAENKTDEPNYQAYLQYIQQINQYSPVEGAGSHGSFGTKIGVGMQITPRAETIDAGSRHLYLTSTNDEPERNTSTKISATRGLSIPVDLGVAFGSIDDTKVQQWAGYVQWTPYQSFGMPAVAMRYSMSKISGLELAEITTHTAELIASYGFLRFFNVFGSIRRHYNIALIHEEKLDSHYEDTTYSSGGGLEIMIWPPFTTLAIESQSPQNGEKPTYMSKLGYLF